MAIDAVIERIRQEDDGLRLYLAPRVEADGQDSIKGTESLIILGKRGAEPAVGCQIWGGADSVEIVDVAEYCRKGNRLRELRLCRKCFRGMHWTSISNTVTGEQREAWRCDHCDREEPL